MIKKRKKDHDENKQGFETLINKEEFLFSQLLMSTVWIYIILLKNAKHILFSNLLNCKLLMVMIKIIKLYTG